MEHNLITISAFADSISAHVAKSQLESHGIGCFLKNDTAVANTGLHVYGPIELMVAEEDVEKAKAILAQE